MSGAVELNRRGTLNDYPESMSGGASVPSPKRASKKSSFGESPKQRPANLPRSVSVVDMVRARAATTVAAVKSGTMTLEIPIPPCWDERDDGIPDCCRGDFPKWWMIFNPKNRWSNDNLMMIAFGNVGFKFFDVERKTYMGIAVSTRTCEPATPCPSLGGAPTSFAHSTAVSTMRYLFVVQ